MKLAPAYSLTIPTTVLFGAGRFAELPRIASGERICLVTTPGFTRRGMTERIAGLLGGRLVSVIDTVAPNPDLDALDRMAAGVRAARPDAVLALGGGSAMDAGKVLAKAATAPEGWTLDAHFRQGVALHGARPLPCHAVATTAGTGAEVTPFATVWDGVTGRKLSFAGPDLFPATALVDPELARGLPREVTLATGLDAISQALESVWNRACNAPTLGLAVQSLRLSLPALAVAAGTPENDAARRDMAEASLLAGIAISHTRTALAHSISYPLTARHGLPHGFACAFTLPALLDFNRPADDGRLAFVANALGLSGVDALCGRIAAVLEASDIRAHLEKYVAEPAGMLALVQEMITPNRSGNTLRAAGLADVRAIVEDSLGRLGM